MDHIQLVKQTILEDRFDFRISLRNV